MIGRIKNVFSDSNLKELISKAGLYLALRVFGFLFAYIFAFIVGNKYGATVYGYLTLGFTVIMIAAVIGRMGFDISLTRLFSSNDDLENNSGLYYKIISLATVISAALAGLIYFTSDIIAVRVFSNEALTSHLKWAALTIPFWVIVMINTAVFRGFKKNTLFSFFNTFGRFLFSTLLLLLFVYVFHEEQVEVAIFSHFLGVCLLALTSFYFIFKLLRKPSFKSTITLKHFSKISFPVLMSATMIILLGWSDKVFLGIFEDEAKVGIYDLAFRIATVIKFSLEAINSILAPKVSKMFFNNNPKELQKIVSFSTNLNTYISLALFLVILVFPNTLLGIVGDEFKEGALVLIILAVGQLIGSLCGSVGVILQMTGNQKIFQYITLITFVLNFVLNLVLIKKFSIVGAAISTSISLVVLNVLAAIYIKRKLNITSYYSLFKL